MLGLWKWKGKNNSIPFDSAQEWIIKGMQRCVDGFWVYQNRSFFASPQLKSLIGYDENSPFLNDIAWWAEQIHPEDIEKLQKFVLSCLKLENKTNQCEVRIRHHHGHWMWQLIKCYPHQQATGGLASLMGAVTNITPYRLLHAQLERTIEEAERISQAKSNFIASLNHELRTPLVGIMGNVNLLQDSHLTNQQETFVNNIATSAELLLMLINDILEISKITAGKLELEADSFSLQTTIKNITDVFSPMAAQKNLSLIVNVDENIPTFVIGDKTRLQQILVNLINNAIKFTLNGQITIKVSIRSMRQKRVIVLFQIIDTGQGISKENLPYLFQDFTQVNPTKSSLINGSGLGLSICKKLVALFGGEIGVQSTLGKGSTFWFTVPFKVINPIIYDVDNKIGKDLPSLRILVAEDNLINQQVFRGLLEKWGHIVTIANNGTEAVNYFQNHPFDIIFMDINMPGMDGISATSNIRNLPKGKEALIFAVSADSVTINQSNANLYGFNGTLSKPIVKEKFLAILEKVQKSLVNLKCEEDTGHSSQETFVDHKHFKDLLEDLGPKTLIHLFGIYLEEAKDIIDKIGDSNPEEAYKLAHTLAGISENLGLKLIGRSARELISTSHENTEEYKNKLTEIQANFNKQNSEIKRIVNALKAST